MRLGPRTIGREASAVGSAMGRSSKGKISWYQDGVSVDALTASSHPVRVMQGAGKRLTQKRKTGCERTSTVIAIHFLCLEPKAFEGLVVRGPGAARLGKIIFEGRHPAFSIFEIHRPPLLQQSHRLSTSRTSRALFGCRDRRHFLQKAALRVRLLAGLRMIIPILPTSRYSPWSHSRSQQYSCTVQIAMICLLICTTTGLSVRAAGWLTGQIWKEGCKLAFWPWACRDETAAPRRSVEQRNASQNQKGSNFVCPALSMGRRHPKS